MKQFLILVSLMLTTQAFSQSKPSPELMFDVLTNPQVKQCLRDFDDKLVNLSLEKVDARCPGCYSITITGNRLEIDIVNPEKTEIKIVSRGRLTNFGLKQTFTCTIKN